MNKGKNLAPLVISFFSTDFFETRSKLKNDHFQFLSNIPNGALRKKEISK